MLAIFAILSDIPAYIAELLSTITGGDFSSVSNITGDIINFVMELAEKVAGFIG